MVHHNSMRRLVQGERNFVARLRQAAMDFRFTIKCGEEMCGGINSYKEEIIRYQCVSGLRCKDTQERFTDAVGGDKQGGS